MRISGGQARGITLRVPKGDTVRPATDGMRQAVFSSLAPRLVGARVLDLFAGSGSYGLEALSRGAAFACFVEEDHKATLCLETNLGAVAKSIGRKASECGRILRLDALQAPLDNTDADLVFIDPPYDLIEEKAPALFERLRLALKPQFDPLLVFEMPGEQELKPVGWECIKRIGKGRRQPSACFFRLSSNSLPASRSEQPG